MLPITPVRTQIRSPLCDLTPGDEGKLGGITPEGVLEDIAVSLNGEPLIPLPADIVFSQAKVPDDQPQQSFLKPFATATTFEFTFREVEVSTGVNFLRLAASDKVPGVGLTGFAELTWDVTATFDNGDPPPRTGIDLTPITLKVLPMQLDFGSTVTSVADLQANVPVRLKVNVETNEMAVPGEWAAAPEFDDDLYVVESTLNESAILFTNANAWVVVYGRDQLDYFLQGYGTYQDLVVQVSVPSLELTNVTTRWRADDTASGKLRHEYTAATLQFQTNALSGEIEAADVIVKRIGIGAVTNTLVRSGTSDTFISADNQTTVMFASSVDTAVPDGEPLSFWVSDSTLGLNYEWVTVTAGGGVLQYQTVDDLRSDLPDGVTNPGYNAYAGWSFENSVPSLVSKSEGGEIRVYYTRFGGPSSALEQLAQKFPNQIIKSKIDQLYYAARNNPALTQTGTPEAHVVTVLKNVRYLPDPQSPLDPLTEFAGFMFGMTSQGAEDIVGMGSFVINTIPSAANYLRLSLKINVLRDFNGYDREQYWEVSGQLEDFSKAVQETWKLWQIASGQEALKAAASLDNEEINRQSEHCRWVNAYLVDLIVAINNEYQEQDAFKRGMIKGRITLEVAGILLPATKAKYAAQVSRVECYETVKGAMIGQGDEQAAQIIGRVANRARAVADPPPNLTGLRPMPVSADVLKVGTEVDTVAERIWGRAEMLMKGDPAITFRAAITQAMAEEAANSGKNAIFRFDNLVNHLLARAPQQFDTAEQAQKFLADLLTYADWNRVVTDKGFLYMITIADQSFYVIAGKVYEGNHILKQQLLRVLRDHYQIPTGTDSAIQSQGWVKIMEMAEHRGPLTGESYHARLNRWEGGVLSDWKLDGIHMVMENGAPKYPSAASVLDEYISFLKAYPQEYGDYVPVVRAFAKVHNIPITE